MHATKAAVEEGIVPGGGVALIRAGKALDTLKLEGDQKVGAEHHPQGDRRAAPLDRDQRGPGRLDRRPAASRTRKGEEGYNAGDRQVREPGGGGRHRPGEGRAHGAPERRRRSPRSSSPPKRSSRRFPRTRRKLRRRRRPRRRRRHGRNVLISRQSTVVSRQSQSTITVDSPRRQSARWNESSSGLFFGLRASVAVV